MDLNLVVQRGSEKLDKANVIKKINTAFKLGYDVVALSVEVGAKELGAKNKIPEPPQYSLNQPEFKATAPRNRRLRILTRLTATLTDSIESHRLFQSPVAKKYDIIAVSVTQEKMFQASSATEIAVKQYLATKYLIMTSLRKHLCNQGEFDIVCLPLDDRLPFVVKRTQYGAATGRGLFFEIQYAPCIRDETSLRNTIANCQTLIHAGKGKGVIISSGAWMPQELRGPYDAANLGFLYGLTECTTHEAVFRNCRNVIMHAETRRKADRAVIFSKAVDELSAKDRWLVEACKVPGTEGAAAKASASGDAKSDGPPPKKKKKKGHS